jgi:hypothetical protein
MWVSFHYNFTLKASQANFDSLILLLLPESMWIKLCPEFHVSTVFREILSNLLVVIVQLISHQFEGHFTDFAKVHDLLELSPDLKEISFWILRN